MSFAWPTKHLPCLRSPLARRSRARRTMTPSARRSWRPRGAAGSSANTPSATAMPTPAWCSTAVTRLEESLAAQRQPEPAPAPDNGLKEALAAIRGAVDAARVAALDGLALEEKLGPVRKGSRIIREIAWRWREIGADGRICDLIDAQIGAIDERLRRDRIDQSPCCVRRHRATARGTRRQRGRIRSAARHRERPVGRGPAGPIG